MTNARKMPWGGFLKLIIRFASTIVTVGVKKILFCVNDPALTITF